ncbi:MAG: hypothetical protein CMN30_07780 [Sandaracinus sp.]|nr:hypothetical protein [Sandaracinus sp.]|tara:strand:- start:368 stop:1045 length:678 start_codon:yes stop_codon:yes gene_type:complete
MSHSVAVFDLDGTLCRSAALDTAGLVAATREVWGIDLDTDWGSYADVSDEGIARESFTRFRGRPPTAPELRELRDALAGRIEASLTERPAACEPVPGARAAIDALRQVGWCVVVATGCWARSAEAKLRHAGLGELSVFGSDGRPRRVDIVRAALASVGPTEGQVLVGDALWDAATARALGLPFVGIADGATAEALHRAGAFRVLRDYTEGSVPELFGAALAGFQR